MPPPRNSDIPVSKKIIAAGQKPKDAPTKREKTATVLRSVGSLDYQNIIVSLRSTYPKSRKGADAARHTFDRAYQDVFPGALPASTPKGFNREKPLSVGTSFQNGPPTGSLPMGRYWGTIMVAGFESYHGYLTRDDPLWMRAGTLG